MPKLKNRKIVLASRPTGEATADNFQVIETEEPDRLDSGVLLKTLWLSLDPYMRGRMSESKSYAVPVGIGEVMVGGTVSQVLASKLDDFAAGDFVVGYTGWQEYARSDGSGLRKLDPNLAPISTALGILGMPGRPPIPAF